MNVLETKRLVLRHMEESDAEFILGLLNEPSFLRYIGDKAVRTLDDARKYIVTGPRASYQEHGFGLYLTERREDLTPMGICGLVKRPGLEAPDIGFAFLPAYWSLGFATEAAAAVIAHGRRVLGLPQIVAITSMDNEASAKVLAKLGLVPSKVIRLVEGGPEVKLFARAEVV